MNSINPAQAQSILDRLNDLTINTLTQKQLYEALKERFGEHRSNNEEDHKQFLSDKEKLKEELSEEMKTLSDNLNRTVNEIKREMITDIKSNYDNTQKIIHKNHDKSQGDIAKIKEHMNKNIGASLVIKGVITFVISVIMVVGGWVMDKMSTNEELLQNTMTKVEVISKLMVKEARK